jgi:hypothetical protein
MARALGPSAVPLWLLLWASACTASSLPRAPSAPDAQPDGLPVAGASCGFAEPVYLDADGDGYGTPDVHVLCEHGFVPSGWSKSFHDCDDSDAAKFRLYNRDADGDGVGAREQICAGAEAPPGYLVETGIPDCDDSNPSISRPYHVDADGDGMPPPDPPEICGPKDQAPPNTVSIYVDDDPGDCDDSDPGLRTL